MDREPDAHLLFCHDLLLNCKNGQWQQRVYQRLIARGHLPVDFLRGRIPMRSLHSLDGPVVIGGEAVWMLYGKRIDVERLGMRTLPRAPWFASSIDKMIWLQHAASLRDPKWNG
jgi:hypothetical protein